MYSDLQRECRRRYALEHGPEAAQLPTPAPPAKKERAKKAPAKTAAAKKAATKKARERAAAAKEPTRHRYPDAPATDEYGNPIVRCTKQSVTCRFL